jgi:hypothetical protein
MYLGVKAMKKPLYPGIKQTNDMTTLGKRIYPTGGSSNIPSSGSSLNDYHSNQASHQYLPTGLKQNRLSTASKNPLEKKH